MIKLCNLNALEWSLSNLKKMYWFPIVFSESIVDENMYDSHRLEEYNRLYQDQE